MIFFSGTTLKVSRKTVVYTDKVKNQVTREEEHKGSREVKKRKVEEALFLDSVQR